MKMVPIQEESELDDFMVEIDILAECSHPNIVKLYEAFFFDEALWVGVCELFEVKGMCVKYVAASV